MPKSKKEKMQSLTQFVGEIEKDIKAFEASYKANHEKDPEHYPLELPESDSGLWFEFFMDFCSE
jgi:hypothetical protein